MVPRLPSNQEDEAPWGLKGLRVKAAVAVAGDHVFFLARHQSDVNIPRWVKDIRLCTAIIILFFARVSTSRCFFFEMLAFW